MGHHRTNFHQRLHDKHTTSDRYTVSLSNAQQLRSSLRSQRDTEGDSIERVFPYETREKEAVRRFSDLYHISAVAQLTPPPPKESHVSSFGHILMGKKVRVEVAFVHERSGLYDKKAVLKIAPFVRCPFS